ncbi:unnamed protein product [Coffea canephora]|uniref:Uncharacterized protein n=1 Tax=Coffea canephora TaxID=49390 RepID=A0A068TUQ5_COFCA|nr:unnamed protein product [Coffea canephora]
MVSFPHVDSRLLYKTKAQKTKETEKKNPKTPKLENNKALLPNPFAPSLFRLSGVIRFREIFFFASH